MPKIDLLKALQELPPGRELDTADYYLEHREYNKGSLANVLTSQFTISIKGVATATINVWRLAGIDYTVNSRTTHLDGDKTFADAVAIVLEGLKTTATSYAERGKHAQGFIDVFVTEEKVVEPSVFDDRY